jgi:hypothetical protein
MMDFLSVGNFITPRLSPLVPATEQTMAVRRVQKRCAGRPCRKHRKEAAAGLARAQQLVKESAWLAKANIATARVVRSSFGFPAPQPNASVHAHRCSRGNVV